MKKSFRTLFKTLTVVLVLGAMGCQTKGYFLEKTPLPVPDIRIAVSAVLGEPRSVSANGRELYSRFHDQQFKYLENQQDRSQPRLYTKVVILGPRRPYDVQVLVLEEEFDEARGVVFEEVNEDLSLRRAIQLRKALHISREKSRGFDVSNPF